VANPEDEIEALAKAYAASRDMERVKSYLERGRPFRGLSPTELERRWVQSGNAFFGDDDQNHIGPFNDLNAEYKLRNQEPPNALLRDALDKARKRFATYPEVDLEPLNKRLAAFLNDMGKPNN